jgi:hypothetical protein
MFPHRFYQAFDACSADESLSTSHRRGAITFDVGSSGVLDDASAEWLSGAIDVSTRNLPDTLDNTFTAIDLSGSMDQTVSGHSELARAEIGALFGAMLLKRDSDAGAFGDSFALVEADEQSRCDLSTLELADRIYTLSDRVGNSTNAFTAIDWATQNEQVYDRFVIFTDEQVWDSTGYVFGPDRSLKSAWDEYTSEVAPDSHLYVIDVASYGDLSMPEGYPQVHQISGWSESVLQFIDSFEQADDVVDEVASIEPTDY